MPEIDYSRYIITKPIREAGPRYELKNRMNPSMTYLSRALIPEAKQYIEFGWIWGMPEPNPHTPEHMHRLDEKFSEPVSGNNNNGRLRRFSPGASSLKWEK